MICRECREQNKKSRVHRTFLRGENIEEDYWDENGKWVFNNYLIYLSVYVCSNGHKWIEIPTDEVGFNHKCWKLIRRKDWDHDERKEGK